MAAGGDAEFFDLLLDSARSGIRANVPESQRNSVSHKLKHLAN